MIDLKIPQLLDAKKQLSEDRCTQILNRDVEIYEKIDGTKLTLFRNNVAYDATDYTKNWIVSYKSNIIEKEEFSGFVNFENKIDKIKQYSIGTSQYYFVHKILEEKIHPNAKNLPINSELFIEFVQRKPTLTRDYEKYHSLFLIGYGLNINAYIDNNRYFSYDDAIFEPCKVRELAAELNINYPPILFIGKMSKLSHESNSTAFQKLSNVLTRLLSTKSVLGNKIEGIVLFFHDNTIYKHTQSDQYNKTIRSQKKSRFKSLNENDEQCYWSGVLDISIHICKSILKVNNKISHLSQLIYNSSFDFLLQFNSNKVEINAQDDVFLTSKLLLQSYFLNTEFVGMYVIAGKPVHLGHWKVIEKALQQTKKVILFISTSDRDNILGKDMYDIWIKYLIPILPKNVHCIFSNSPMQELMHQINFLENHKKILYSHIIIYADQFDALQLKQNNKIALDCVTFNGINRITNVDISGTLMRQFLKSDIKELFKKYLPPVNDDIKEKIWLKLKK